MVAEDHPAEVLVVNTCTVTARADRKSRQAVYQASARQPRLTVATGCSVEQFSADYAALDGVIAVPNGSKSRIFDIVDAALRGEIVDLMAFKGDSFAYAPAMPEFRTRASIKIADGCSNACSFCIIPRVRGAARSRPLPEIVNEAESLLSGGVRELVLTGVNMSRYSHDGHGFSDVLAALLNLQSPVSEASPDYRVRISSIEPDGLDDGFMRALSHPRLAPHLHLCLQSGSSRTLLAMRRMYTREGYDELVSRIRSARPDIDLTTDILVGFPGEQDEDFRLTLDAVEQHRFSHVHAFPYSLRAGTRAVRMPGRVPAAEIRSRMGQLSELSQRIKREERAARIGSQQSVLVETSEGGARGIGDHYLHVQISAPAASELPRPGELVRTRITGLGDGPDPDALGILVGSNEREPARKINRPLS